MSDRQTWRWRLVTFYIVLLLASHLIRALQKENPVSIQSSTIDVQAFAGDKPIDQTVRLAYREFIDDSSTQALTTNEDPRPVIVLLHGSPSNARDFNSLAPYLAQHYRVIRPDLPGFGDSSHQVPDYSLRAHAHYILALLDKLHIKRAHILGFSMGGGVALNIADLAPERTASLIMLSAIGVQEMELLGDYHLNHAVHGLQLAGLWTLRELTPHFGYLDKAALNVSYGRNFYDSDQRPLRDILSRYPSPMLILHGKKDVLVPVEAALEHHRLVPQSELQIFPEENHFMVFTKGERLAEFIIPFLDKVEQGTATTRQTASRERLEYAAQPFDPAHLPKAKGVALLILILLLAAATLVSEDLTCISAGLLVAQGRMNFLAAAFACFVGIFIGDVLLFLAGRYFGRAALHHAPLKWFIRAKEVERSSRWFNRNGLAVIGTSRFIPGARLPTYFAAGLLHTDFWWFCLYFVLAGVVWSPLLIGLSTWLGAEALKSALISNQTSFLKILGFGLLALIVLRVVMKLTTYRGRRLLLAFWKRKVKWEFWSPLFFYPPVIFYVLFLMIKHRSMTLFTAANPAIMSGGFIGESKAEILHGLAAADGFIARSALIKATLDADERLAQAAKFMRENAYDFPVVLKPDLGQRGSGVLVARSDEALRAYLQQASGDTIIQEYVAGVEFGVFYYRYPESERGKIFAITEKRFPVVKGDGKSTLERLILQDERAVCMAKFYCEQHTDRLDEVLSEGEQRQLVELGTHCRGAIFLDGAWAITAELEAAIDRVSKHFEGFYFGRYDIRAASIEEFQRGENFKVIELNGVTSEATNIYDPKNSLFAAYRVLFKQWRMAFEIGAQNRQRGATPSSVRELIKLLWEFRQRNAK
ncbi:MAG: alpha/beta fold hydrolase [Acidobacteria bacterium]|nr:alpha/beta fold hydrolase [Acidobacteriota bacterium]